ncbi:hypothetical protein DFP94_10492 [Fontibacillus phaseoli]|uniref:Uncharacterized protein n=1 Tax=Fontibacillus phaseoli TaxID=1416533 RepID=A0A369BE11_9BACL|nr:hypothetical protein [Fontibacillus phaseoli]RCX19641.1 hypothetical protein DFP94_10492 [Fontibacillus phaseoli]
MTGARNKEQVFEIRGLGLNDEVLAMAELERDPVFHKIAPDKYGYYISRSLDMGREAAVRLKGRDIRELLDQAGVKFNLAASAGTGAFKVALRAQLDWSGKVPKITVYRESMRQLHIAAEAAEGALGPVTFDRIVDIHLAHEYYHLLEYRGGQFTNELLDPVECLKIGPFRRTATILQSSEIAAHAFCKELLGLPYLPSLLDNIYLMQTGHMKMEQFAENVKKWKTILSENGLHML